MRTRSLTGWAGALAVALLVSLGCLGGSDKETAHLQGTVTLGGQPIPADADARIVVRPTQLDQVSASAAVIRDGRYDLPDAPLGEVEVSFTIQRPTGRRVDPGDGGRPVPEYEFLVPQDERQVIQVDGDKLDLNFEL